MPHSLTLDSSSFERLLAAALVLQHRNEQEAHDRRSGPAETLPEPAEIHLEAESLPVTNGDQNTTASFPGSRARAGITFDHRFTASRRRAITKAVPPIVVLGIMLAFTLTQVWDRGHLLTVAALSKVDHPSDKGAAGKVVHLTPPDQVSHMHITDGEALSVVEELSRYEIPALLRQARYGDDSAALTMGMLYETGHFVPRNCAKAAAWISASANAGNAAAQYNLGLRYRDGDGLPPDPAEAAKWLRKAADQRYLLALEMLAPPDPRSP